MKIRENHSSASAFTLIELLVVIGIIGILGSLLLPVLSSAKAQARSTVCKNHLKQMGIALNLYADENGNRYPFYRGEPSLIAGGAAGPDDTRYWWSKLTPYYPLQWMDPAYHCPGYKGQILGSLPVHGGYTFPLGSYAYNANGVRLSFGSGFGPSGSGGNYGLGGMLRRNLARGQSGIPLIAEVEIVSPSEMFAIGESRFWAKWSTNGGRDFMSCGSATNNAGALSFDPARHGKNYNQLFCDGHVTGMAPFFLFNPSKSAVMWNNDHQPHPEVWSPYW